MKKRGVKLLALLLIGAMLCSVLAAVSAPETKEKPGEREALDVSLDGLLGDLEELDAQMREDYEYWTYNDRTEWKSPNYRNAYVEVSLALDRNKLALQPGQSVQLNAKLDVKKRVILPITWTSSDKSIASVDEYGRVRAYKTGNVVIAAQAGTAVAPLLVEVDPEKTSYPSGEYGQAHRGYYLAVQLWPLEGRYEAAMEEALVQAVHALIPPNWKEGEIVEEATTEELIQEPDAEPDGEPVEEETAEEEMTGAEDPVDEEPVEDEPVEEEPLEDAPAPEPEEEYAEEEMLEDPAEEPELPLEEADEEPMEEPGETEEESTEEPDASHAEEADAPDVSGESYEGTEEQPFVKTGENPFSTVSVDVDTASYANLRRYIRENKQLPPADAVRVEEMVNYFSYDYPQPKGDAPVDFSAEVMDCPWNEGALLMKVALQAKDLIAEKRQTGTYLSVLGFGMGNYRDDMVKTLSYAGNGNYAYIDNLEEAEKVLVAERNATMLTVAQDVKWQIEFNPETVAEYRLIGYDKRVLAKEDFADDSVDAGEMGAGHNVTVFYEIIPAKNAPADGNYATLRLRYKQPGGDSSKLYEEPVTASLGSEGPSTDGAFAAAVVEAALVLKDSRYKGSASLDHALKVAESNLGTDKAGYRADFVKLLEEAKKLK